MSSSGITAVNSGPIIIRTCLNSSSKTVVLTDYDYPVSSNRVLITSTSGYVTASDNIYISSITCSTIACSTINSSTINTRTINASTINASTINASTINSSTINTSIINLSTLNGGPYGFSTIVVPISTIFTNDSLYTVPPNTSSITFTLIGAGGSSNSVGINSGGGGGGGSGVTLTIKNPSNSVFALYPGTSNIGSGFGGGMSILFSTNGNNYTCIAIAGGGGGGGGVNDSGGFNGGGGGGNNGVSYTFATGGGAGNNGQGGAGGFYNTFPSGGNGDPGSDFGGLVYTFPTISVGGGGGAGYTDTASNSGGNGGDGYGGGGGGAVGIAGAGGGGGGNYCYADNVTYFSSVSNGYNGTDSSGGAPGIIINSYGYGGTNPDDGQPGVIQVVYNSYITESLYDLIPNTIQTLGSLVSSWSTIFTSSITMSGSISTSGFKVSGLQTTGNASNLYYDTGTNQIMYNVSMAKYKSNIVDLSLDTTSIYNLNPREYDFIDGKHCVGFIAEEVDKVDTMLAAKNNDDTPVNINWYGVTTYLVNEMKKLNERVKNLEQKNLTLI